MKKTRLGGTGFDVSALGFGGAPVGYLKTDQERAARVLNLLLDAGVNLIDTAASYPGSEELIAKTIGHRRAGCGVGSKCGRKVAGVDGGVGLAGMISGTDER